MTNYKVNYLLYGEVESKTFSDENTAVSYAKEIVKGDAIYAEVVISLHKFWNED